MWPNLQKTAVLVTFTEEVVKEKLHFCTVLVNNILYGKLVPWSEFPIKFDEKFKVTSVPFFIPDFNLISCELDNLTLNVFIESYDILILH